MEYETLKSEIYKLNEDEQFYRKYYYAKQQQYSLKKFLAELDLNRVYERNLLVPEIKNTIPLQYEDWFYFDPAERASIITMRHNRYSPLSSTTTRFLRLSMSTTAHANRPSAAIRTICPRGISASFRPESNTRSVCLTRVSSLTV